MLKFLVRLYVIIGAMFLSGCSAGAVAWAFGPQGAWSAGLAMAAIVGGMGVVGAKAHPERSEGFA